MQKGLRVRGEYVLITALLLVLVAGLVIAADNSTNSTNSTDTNNTNNGTNNTITNSTNSTSNNETNQTLTCTRDDDCADNYECKNNVCVQEDKENETNRENKTRDNENDREDSNKVCCKIYMKQERKNETEEKTKYIWIDNSSCTSRENEKDKIFTKEIMNDTSLCRGKLEVREKQRIKFEERTNQTCPANCSCMGVVMKCPLNGGRQITIFAGESGKIIIQIQGVNMTTNVTVYSENGTLIGQFGNGEIKQIKITPDEVRTKFREKEKGKIENESIELKDNGFYEYKANKRARLLGMIPVKEKVTTEIDPQTGNITTTKTSWWGFLARDEKD